MKLFDRYILRRFIYNFLVTFTVLMFIFFFQTIWLFIQEIAGKNIGIINIIKFLVFYTPGLSYITIPLSVVVASIMTFGSLAEKYEFVGIKVAGISLARVMRPLSIFMILLCGFTFYTANNLIPLTEYKNYRFQYDISRARPSLAITQGVFSSLGNFNIKVDRKYGEDERFLENVVIHKTTAGGINNVVIKAKYGELASADINNFVKLILKEGYYYEDKIDKGNIKIYSHSKSRFQSYLINIDLLDIQQDKFDESKQINTYRMMTSGKISTALDSLEANLENEKREYVSDFYRRSNYTNIDNGLELTDNTAGNKYHGSIDSLLSGLTPPLQREVVRSSLEDLENTFHLLESRSLDFEVTKKNINKYVVSYHEKFSLAFACLILFFTGAPLGAIIRKGGIGLPMVVAIVLFLSYYFISILMKNLGESGDINPILSTWIANIVIFPLGIILTGRVASDGRRFKFSRLYTLLDRALILFHSLFNLKKKIP